MTVAPMLRTCACCGEERRCRFTGARWICETCFASLFPKDAA